MRTIEPRFRSAVALMVVVSLATVLAYSTGLSGPFLLDDATSLPVLGDWLAGRVDIWRVLSGDTSGMSGRPISMGSFALSAGIFGFTPFAFKAGNLALHLACGWIAFALFRRLLQRDARMGSSPAWWAAIAVSLWLLHPLFASTVLYAVQRMAQLSTLFVLVGLWLYVSARDRMEHGPSRTASATILAGIPAITLLAIFSKENGALLPFLCIVLEFVWYPPARPWAVRAFIGAYALLPAILVSVILLVQPQRFLNYAGREFTLAERLLTQPRALCDYLWKLVAPNPPQMGIFTDDFALSTGLLAPPTTLTAILVLLALTLMAWRWRKRAPAAAFGWLFFLTAHAMESGILPLELYFEHRNYLPSIGLMLCMAGIAAIAGDALAKHGVRTRRIGGVLLVATLAVLVLGTHGRARVWRDPVLIAESGLSSHPQSLRANAFALDQSMAYRDRERVYAVIDNLSRSPVARQRSLANGWRLYADCALEHDADPATLRAFVATIPATVMPDEIRLFQTLHPILAQGGCGRVTDRDIGLALVDIVQRAHVSRPSRLYQLDQLAAAYFVRGKEWRSTLAPAERAWSYKATTSNAIPLAMARIKTGDIAGARRLLDLAEAHSDLSDATQQANLRVLRGEIRAVQYPH